MTPTPSTSSASRPPGQSAVVLGLVACLISYFVLGGLGLTWGLPTSRWDRWLFGSDEEWLGKRIAGLVGVESAISPEVGADVDVDRGVGGSADGLRALSATPRDVAALYLRFRLYSHQPDEMITMRALAGMRPRSLNLDPRLYQYGGLFLYPVGGWLQLASILGLVDLRSDLAYYLDRPDAFGRFYVVVRSYSLAWGAVGVLVVHAIAGQFSNRRGGVIAAMLFAGMPVVVCMAHEGKPHLPGAVLMLSATWCAIHVVGPHSRIGTEDRQGPESGSSGGRVRLKPAVRALGSCADPSPQDRLVDRRRETFWWWMMCAVCGSAVGMVLSSWPILVLIPLVEVLRRGSSCGDAARATGDTRGSRMETVGVPRPASASSRGLEWLVRPLLGLLVSMAAYLLSNPYVLINAVRNRELLRSNFGNSLAMYEVGRMGDGLLRVMSLSWEGAGTPIIVLGFAALASVLMMKRSRWLIPRALLLIVPASIFLLQFSMIGAGKPAEYGRFVVFTNSVLAIGAGCAAAHLMTRWMVMGRVLAGVTVIWVMACGAAYTGQFWADARPGSSRMVAAEVVESLRLKAESDESGGQHPLQVIVGADPAPYSCPPMNFARIKVTLDPGPPSARVDWIGGKNEGDGRTLYLGVVDEAWPVDAIVCRDALEALVHLEGGRRVVVTGRGSGGGNPLRLTPISWANKPLLLAWVGAITVGEFQRPGD